MEEAPNIPKELIDIFSYHHWRHRVDLGNGLSTPGYNTMPDDWRLHNLPESIIGKSFLDVGANDGYYSFEAERRGASEVTATDIYVGDGSTMKKGWDSKGIDLLKSYLQSRVIIENCSLYKLPELRKSWDVVWCGDVLSWVENLPNAIEILSELCNETLIIKDTFYIKQNTHPQLLDLGEGKFRVQRMNLEFLKNELQKQKFEIENITAVSAIDQYLMQDKHFPGVWSNAEVDVYENPYSNVKIHTKKLDGNWVLGEVNNFIFVRDNGWVKFENLVVKPRSKNSGLRSFLKKAVPAGLLNKYRLQKTGETEFVQFTVVARRVK